MDSSPIDSSVNEKKKEAEMSSPDLPDSNLTNGITPTKDKDDMPSSSNAQSTSHMGGMEVGGEREWEMEEECVDDETTLNEEEEHEEADENELMDLQEDGDLPIEKLLEKYGYEVPSSTSAPTTSTSASTSTSSKEDRASRRRKREEQRKVEEEKENVLVEQDVEQGNDPPPPSLPDTTTTETEATSSKLRKREQSDEVSSQESHQPSSHLSIPNDLTQSDNIQQADSLSQVEIQLQETVQEDEVGSSHDTPGMESGSGEGEEEDNTASLKYMMEGGEMSDSEEDEDYVPPEKWKKEPRIGPEYQVGFEEIPEAQSGEGREDEVEISGREGLDDVLLWKPGVTEEKVEDYLRKFFDLMKSWSETTNPEDNTENGGINGEPEENGCPDLPDSRSPIKDDPSALFLLIQNKFKAENALKKQETINSAVPRSALENWNILGRNPDERVKALEGMVGGAGEGLDERKVWNEEEANLFEEGLKTFGKDFVQIKNQFFPNRKVGELVEYYYSWKKTERHDIFVQKVRFEKARFNHNPNTTDFMDMFINQIDGGGHSHSHHPLLMGGGRGGMGGMVDLPDSTEPEDSSIHLDPHPADTPGTSPTYAVGSLLSSDPKHTLGQFHPSHFNEYNPYNSCNSNNSAAAIQSRPSTSNTHQHHHHHHNLLLPTSSSSSLPSSSNLPDLDLEPPVLKTDDGQNEALPQLK